MTRARTALMFVASLLPVAGVWVAKVVAYPRPFWVHFYDPETIHFYAGLHLLRGLVPENVDNPGTPLQIVSAAIAMLTGATPARYETFLAVAHTVGLLFAIGGSAVVFFGIAAEASALARVTAVWIYFCAPQAFERIDVWSPEIAYLPAGAAAMALFLRWTRNPDPRHAALAGVAVGLAIAIKFVFAAWAPALILTILVSRRLRDTVFATAGVVFGFLIGTLPVVGEYPHIVRRQLYLSSTAHADYDWPTLLLSSKGWLVCLSLVVVGAVLFARGSSVTIFVAATAALTVASTVRNPSFRYLLPLGIAAAGLFAVSAASPRFSRGWQLVSALLVAGVLTRAAAHDIAAHTARIAHGRTIRVALETAVPKRGIVVYGWRTPIPSFALRINTKNPLYFTEVSKLHPREGHFNPWTGRVYLPAGATRWDYAVVQADDRRRLHGREIARVDAFVVLESMASQ